MESWERIEYIIKKEGLNKNSFSKAIGISNNVTITRIINERRAPSRATCEKIISAFPLYNLEWLLTGEGEMINQKPSETILNTNNTNKGVPYFEDIEASCSILEMPMSTIENPTFYIDYEHFNDCTAYIPVVGDSMYPQYCAGEIVAVKKVNNPNILQWGEAYLVITNSEANDLRTIKLVHQSENNDEIILRASNPDYKGDTIIPKKDIISMFIIKGKIKRNQL